MPGNIGEALSGVKKRGAGGPSRSAAWSYYTDANLSSTPPNPPQGWVDCGPDGETYQCNIQTTSLNTDGIVSNYAFSLLQLPDPGPLANPLGNNELKQVVDATNAKFNQLAQTLMATAPGKLKQPSLELTVLITPAGLTLALDVPKRLLGNKERYQTYAPCDHYVVPKNAASGGLRVNEIIAAKSAGMNPPRSSAWSYYEDPNTASPPQAQRWVDCGPDGETYQCNIQTTLTNGGAVTDYDFTLLLPAAGPLADPLGGGELANLVAQVNAAFRDAARALMCKAGMPATSSPPKDAPGRLGQPKLELTVLLQRQGLVLAFDVPKPGGRYAAYPPRDYSARSS